MHLSAFPVYEQWTRANKDCHFVAAFHERARVESERENRWPFYCVAVINHQVMVAAFVHQREVSNSDITGFIEVEHFR